MKNNHEIAAELGISETTLGLLVDFINRENEFRAADKAAGNLLREADIKDVYSRSVYPSARVVAVQAMHSKEPMPKEQKELMLRGMLTHKELCKELASAIDRLVAARAAYDDVLSEEFKWDFSWRSYNMDYLFKAGGFRRLIMRYKELKGIK